MTGKLVSLLGMLAVVAAISLGRSDEACAQTADQKRLAKEHFQNARRLYDVGRYAESIDEYQKAYINVEDPVFLYNMAQAYRLNNQPDEALRMYKNFLRRSPTAENRGDVEAKIKEMEQIIASGKKPPPTNPTNPVVVAPPPPNPDTPPPVVTAPPPVVTTPPPPDGAGDKGGAVGVVANTTPPPPSSGKSRTLTYGLLIGGGAGIALGAVFGALANGKAKDVETSTTFDPADEKSGQAFNAAAIAFGLAGTVAAGIGLYMLLFDRDKPESTSAAARRPKLALFPAVAPGFAGAGAAMRF